MKQPIMYYVQDWDGPVFFTNIEGIKATYSNPVDFCEVYDDASVKALSVEELLELGIAKKTEFNEEELDAWAKDEVETTTDFLGKLPAGCYTGSFGYSSVEEAKDSYKSQHRYSWTFKNENIS